MQSALVDELLLLIPPPRESHQSLDRIAERTGLTRARIVHGERRAWRQLRCRV